MLATFIIGLREGLEAALIVGIVAAFLKRNGRRLTPMWLGVAAALVLSLVVGITLALVEQSLPQAAQEGMETVIGVVAIFFVTTMILWMSKHSRGLKKELEASAQEALGDGTSRALVVMAFLAVLKEGFETSVFLLATFQAASNAATAATGAVLGVVVAIGLGIGIYRGGVRINLSKFFRGTGLFLVLVAAGLVVSALRTAHEAGWLNAGQQRTVGLGWLAPVGSVRGALFTGVLGIPADPRLIEVVGWLCYLVPMLAIVLWPPARRPGAVAAIRLKQGIAGLAVVIAAVLALVIPAPSLSAPGRAPLVDASGSALGSAMLQPSNRLAVRTAAGTTTYQLSRTGQSTHDATQAEHLTGALDSDTGHLPGTLTLDDLVALSGGRVPVGIDVQRNPGPYTARWSQTAQLDVWTVSGTLLDATANQSLIVSLSGGGLPTPRPISVSAGATLPGAGASAPLSWTVATSYVDQVANSAQALANDRAEAQFWGRFVPLLLLVTAGALLVVAERRRRALALSLGRTGDSSTGPSSSTDGSSSTDTDSSPATDPTSGTDRPISRRNVHAG